MGELLSAFGLGNAAILTNACLLPLYPGLIAFLAGNAENERSRRATAWLGLMVLAGILTMMLVVGWLLYLLNLSFGSALSLLLPIIYAVVIAFGLLILLDRNPFTRLTTTRAPVLHNPYITAFLYGLLYGPMTLPCTGPIILSAFALGAGNAGELANGLLYFFAFGLGFGWPLVLLPLVAMPIQRRLVKILTHNHLILVRVSGVLLIAVGVFGVLTEVLPQYSLALDAALTPLMWVVYWFAVAAIAIALAIFTYRREHDKERTQQRDLST